jgi:hypothetical protein
MKNEEIKTGSIKRCIEAAKYGMCIDDWDEAYKELEIIINKIQENQK